jgi:hypothetical protein
VHIGLPQEVGGLPILFHFIICSILFYFILDIFITHTRCSYGSPKGLVALIFYFILLHFILVYFQNTHQVLVGLPQEVDGLAILFYFSLFFITRTR